MPPIYATDSEKMKQKTAKKNLFTLSNTIYPPSMTASIRPKIDELAHDPENS